MMDRSRIREGMAVYSSDGEKLGKVLTCDEHTFVIEKGFFFPKDYVARYDYVADVRGDEIQLSLTKDGFREGEGLSGGDAAEAGRGWSGAGGFSADDRAAGLRASEADDARPRQDPQLDEGCVAGATDDIRVPVVQGELDVVKVKVVEGERTSEEDIRRHVQAGEDPGTVGVRRDDPDLDR